MAMMGTGTATGEQRGVEAARAAISSPLLENVNLQGARGILVNVTAGLDLSMGDFDDVGNTVREIASENATIVMGTVVDPEMSGDMRVTVVATGLGQADSAGVRHTGTGRRIESVRSAYAEYDRPTFEREPQRAATIGNTALAQQVEEEEYLDIPAFLRRQAD
jgi:cell division protein FtsZ